MLKTLSRILSMFALALALIAALLDLTRSIADSTIVMTPMGVDWLALSPVTLNLAQSSVEQYLHPLLWDPVIVTILKAPSWFVFAALWLVLALLGRRKKSRWQSRYEA
jgi:hypothetical protein